MYEVPEAMLDDIAARPDEPGVWEVLTDYLLEHDAPGATLARCDLELFRGISNPLLLEALSEARARRPKLALEARNDFTALWRCGFVVRLQLTSGYAADRVKVLMEAPALRGLHHLRWQDTTARNESIFEGDFQRAPVSVPERMAQLMSSTTPHLRRFSLRLEGRRRPLPPSELSEVLCVLTAGLPKKVERVDLAVSELAEPPLGPLTALAQRVKALNLDGTSLVGLSVETVLGLVQSAPGCTFFLGGTGLSTRELAHPRVQWLAPDVVASLENEAGALTPLTPEHAHDGFSAPSWPQLSKYLKRELRGWSRADGSPIEGRALLLVDGEVWKFAAGEGRGEGENPQSNRRPARTAAVE